MNAASTSPATSKTDTLAPPVTHSPLHQSVRHLSHRILDSRRLMGPNLFARRAGALLHVAFAPEEGTALLLAWRTTARYFSARLGWPDPEIVVTRHPGGAQCFLGAPLDALLAATEVSERSWIDGERIVAGHERGDLHDDLARLRVHAQHERAPLLEALQGAAVEHGVTFAWDDDVVSLGAGAGSLTLSRSALPAPDEIDWDTVHDIPVALVTGSNGKTTTTRLLSAILATHGQVTGFSCTDGVWCAGEQVDAGDYSGPVGARLVLRDRRVSAAVLETARGGMLRRGLATDRAMVAIVTRVSADHFGEYGVHDLDDLGRAKLVVARALVDGGRLVLNAEDATLVRLAPAVKAPITWFALDPASPVVAAHRARGGDACILRDGEVRYLMGDDEISLGAVAAMPLTLGRTARYNIANVLAASAAAMALHVPVAAIRATLAGFGAAPEDNPGRLTLLEYRGARIVVDFVHNPDGWYALYGVLSAIPARRRIVVVGQGGDRDDHALDELAAAVWSDRPALVILKEMPKYLRGRPLGEVTARLATALLALGAPASAVRRVDSEEEAIQLALAEVTPGDLLALSVHTDYDRAMQLLRDAGATRVTALT